MSRLAYIADTAIDDRTPTHPSAPVHFEHYCDHPGCNAWGSFGYDRGKGKWIGGVSSTSRVTRPARGFAATDALPA